MQLLKNVWSSVWTFPSVSKQRKTCKFAKTLLAITTGENELHSLQGCRCQLLMSEDGVEARHDAVQVACLVVVSACLTSCHDSSQGDRVLLPPVWQHVVQTGTTKALEARKQRRTCCATHL
ncbi:hypothetical protein ABBQ32_001072 [Trebouxia sp. C0010 RCD-2024]